MRNARPTLSVLLASALVPALLTPGCGSESDAPAPASASADTNTAPASTDAASDEAAPEAFHALCERLGLDADHIAELRDTPLYEFEPADVDAYLRYLAAAEPDLRQRIVHLARKNVGQPYEIYLLGEMPFEHIDPQPIYSLDKSDCVVFAEHTYAMALSDGWPGFIAMLQRIRYRDGQISVLSRNHFTEADWNHNNAWLVRDVTAELAGDAAARFAQKVDRARFFEKRYGLETDLPVEPIEDVFLPFERIDRAKPHLREGDFVNVVRGIPGPDAPANELFGGSAWVGHVGLITIGDDGTVHMIHSASPAVREEPIDAYIAQSTKNLAERDKAGKARLLGFKFLRLEPDPLSNLRRIDGPDAPIVRLPDGRALTLQ